MFAAQPRLFLSGDVHVELKAGYFSWWRREGPLRDEAFCWKEVLTDLHKRLKTFGNMKQPL